MQSAACSTRAPSTMPSRDMRPSDDSARLSATESPSTRPCALRSSGTNAMPAAIASARRCAARPALPSTLIVPVAPRARDAEQRRQRRGAAGAHRTGERDDLAGADRERQVVDDGAAGQGGVLDAQVRDLEHGAPCVAASRARAWTSPSSLPVIIATISSVDVVVGGRRCRRARRRASPRCGRTAP